MRPTITLCSFLFDHLDFDQIESSAFADNPASNRVSVATGYRPNGVGREVRGDGWVAAHKYVLTRQDLIRGAELRVEGADEVRRLIGLDG